MPSMSASDPRPLRPAQRPLRLPARRRALLALPALVAAALAPVPSAWAAATPAPTVADAIARDPRLHIAAALLKQSGLDETLRGPGPYTVFVPQDAAFHALTAEQIDSLKDPVKLRQVLAYHVIPGRLTSSDVTGPTPMLTLGGRPAMVSKGGEVLTVDEAMVLRTDATPANGIVQVIDTVLTMPRY